jgi:hypothetical protein
MGVKLRFLLIGHITVLSFVNVVSQTYIQVSGWNQIAQTHRERAIQ